jgi:nicotinate-nucleotide pyrophosphorylase
MFAGRAGASPRGRTLTADARPRAIAESGVHYVSVGALTHSAPSVDIALEITAVRA